MDSRLRGNDGKGIIPSVKLLLFFLSFLIFQSCTPTRFFYFPNRALYVDPDKAGLSYQLLEIPSLNGRKLCAMMFETKHKPRGTIVHFHGNFGNISNHFTQAYPLTSQGFDVLVFDYQGFGSSEGQPTPRKTVEDGLAVVQYAKEHDRSKSGVVVFGQSLGAAVAAVVAVKDPSIKAVVLEAGFSSYPSIARFVLGKSWLLWPLYPIYPLLVGRTYDPIRYVAKISPRPIFFIHGDRDHIVPVRMSRQLFEKAREPKALWIIPGADHLDCRTKMGHEYDTRIGDFFAGALRN